MSKTKVKTIEKHYTGQTTAGNYFRVYQSGRLFYYEPSDESNFNRHYAGPFKTEAKAIADAQLLEDEYR